MLIDERNRIINSIISDVLSLEYDFDSDEYDNHTRELISLVKNTVYALDSYLNQ